MTRIDLSAPERVHVLSLDIDPAEAATLPQDSERLAAIFDDATVDPSRLVIVDTATLSELGLSNYLAEGEGVDAAALSGDKARLDAIRRPVMVVLPRAGAGEATVTAPARHEGSYPLEGMDRGGAMPMKAGKGLLTGTPPEPEPGPSPARQSGMVAIAALVAAFMITLIVVWVAS